MKAWVAALVAGAFLFAGECRAADWQAGAGADWQKLLAAGQKEGSLAVAGRGEMAQPMTEAFKRDTGITLDFLGGEGRDQFTRLAREMRAGQVTIDIIFDGQSLIPFVNDGYIKAIKPQLLLPGVNDLKNWRNGKIKWVDKEQEYMFEGSEYVFGWILIDTDVIKPGELTSWKDLMKPEYKGKIASFDPRVGGPGQANASYVADLFGIDFVKHLYADQKVVLSNSSRQLVDWVAHGNYPIALATLAAEIESFRAAGITNLEAIYMKDGPGADAGRQQRRLRAEARAASQCDGRVPQLVCQPARSDSFFRACGRRRATAPTSMSTAFPITSCPSPACNTPISMSRAGISRNMSASTRRRWSRRSGIEGRVGDAPAISSVALRSQRPSTSLRTRSCGAWHHSLEDARSNSPRPERRRRTHGQECNGAYANSKPLARGNRRCG